MSLPASDNFVGTNGTALTVYSASWSNDKGAFQIQSNNAAANLSGDDAIVYWNADVFPNDQYSQATMTAISTTHMGPAVRCPTVAAQTAYIEYGYSDHISLYKAVATNFTQLASVSLTTAVNDVLRIEVVGTAISCKRNGSLLSFGVKTDSALTSGQAGMAGFGTLTTFRLGTWSGGSMVVADLIPGTLSQPTRHYLPECVSV